jgi:HAMP domain-containing protein
VIAIHRKVRSASSGLSDRHHPEKVIVFTGIRTASYPLIMTIVSLFSWLIAGLFFAQGGFKFLTADSNTFGRTFLGIGIVGGITVSTLIFLTADTLWQRHLPTFFPDGSFQGLGVVRVTVGQRLIVTFLLTGLMPLIILAVTTRNGLLEVMGVGVEPSEILSRFSSTVFFIVTLSIVTNALLISLTSRSLLRPLHMLISAINQVKTGDLSPRVTVTSNDELGDVGFQFNTMLTELV